MRAGGDGKRIQADYLWHRWINMQDDGGLLSGRPRSHNIWAYNANRRSKLRADLESKYKDSLRATLYELMSGFNKLKAKQVAIWQEDERRVLREKRIIACTTSGAAIHNALLEDAKPGVILVEEAAEILEAHVLSSLVQSSKHLILIGDHKQLAS